MEVCWKLPPPRGFAGTTKTQLGPMTTKRRLPGTTGTDISEDRKGDPTKATPNQPDILVDERESLDDAVEEEPWSHKDGDEEDDENP
jgi:hypothetical protein